MSDSQCMYWYAVGYHEGRTDARAANLNVPSDIPDYQWFYEQGKTKGSRDAELQDADPDNFIEEHR